MNVIFKRNFKGTELNARYANTTDTDVGEARFSLLWGDRLNNRANVTVSIEHFTRNLLMTPDRKVSIPAGDSVSGASNPGLFTPVATPAQRLAANATIAGDPGHVAGTTNVNVLVPLRWFVDTPGTALTTAAQVPAAFNPTAFLTLPASTPVAARNTARDAEETRMNGLLPSNSPVRYGPNKVLLPGVNPGFPFGYFTYAVRPADFSSFSLTSDIDVTKDIVVFGDLLVSRNESVNALAASPLGGRTVPATNYWYGQVFPRAAAAGNSFGLAYRPTEIGPRLTYNRFDEVLATVGVKGTLAEKYRFQLAYLRDEQLLKSTQTGGVLATVFNNALAATTAAAAFNPFSFTPMFSTTSPGNPPALLDTFTGAASSFFRAKYNTVDGNVSGPVWQLPAGPLEASVGAEWRRENIDNRHDSALLTGAIFPFNVTSNFIAQREIVSYNAELNVPVLRSLSASAAARHEDYDDVGKTGWKPRISFRWEPLSKQLTLRGSWAQGFVAPGQQQISVSAPFQTFTELFNPLTSVRTQPTRGVIRVGNAGLQPTKSDTWLAGVVYSPKAVRGVTVGANYYRIEQTNIPFTSDQYIVNQWWEAGGPNNANNPFGPSAGPSAQNPLGAQVELNGDGSLNQVRNSGPINSGKRNTDGLDFFANYRQSTEIGELTAEASWTKVLTFEQENFPGAGLIDYLGYYWPSGSALGNYGFPEWKGSVNGSWKKGRFSAGVGFNYVDGYLEQGNRNNPIPSYSTWDVRLGYRIPWLEAQLTVGSNNVFDRQVPFLSTSFENQYDRAIGDIRGRMVFVELTKRF